MNFTYSVMQKSEPVPFFLLANPPLSCLFDVCQFRKISQNTESESKQKIKNKIEKNMF